MKKYNHEIFYIFIFIFIGFMFYVTINYFYKNFYKHKHKHKLSLIRVSLNNIKHQSLETKYVKKYCKMFNVKEYLVKGIIKVESNNGKYLKSSSACGIMQLEPETASMIINKQLSCKELINNKKLNIKIGILYLKSLLLQFPKLAFALAAYNAGPTRTYYYYYKLGYIPQSNNNINNVYGYVIKVINATNKFLVSKNKKIIKIDNLQNVNSKYFLSNQNKQNLKNNYF